MGIIADSAGEFCSNLLLVALQLHHRRSAINMFLKLVRRRTAFGEEK
jgi:hypothetical protein